MADAFDLAWKLQADLRGWGGPNLLGESYVHERRLAARELLVYRGVDFSADTPAVRASSHRAAMNTTNRTSISGRVTTARRSSSTMAGLPPTAAMRAPIARRQNRGGALPMSGGAGVDRHSTSFGTGFTLLRTNADVDPATFERAGVSRSESKRCSKPVARTSVRSRRDPRLRPRTRACGWIESLDSRC